MALISPSNKGNQFSFKLLRNILLHFKLKSVVARTVPPRAQLATQQISVLQVEKMYCTK